MQVESTPGLGSQFRVRLYLPQLHGAQAAAQSARRARSGYEGTRRRLLIVDNEAVDREWLRQALTPLGFEIAEAGSGEAALAMHDEFRPDAIFLDLAMPGLDGWETLRRLREQGSPAQIAIVSANAFDRGQENNIAAELGIREADFIVKPVRIERLLDWLGDALQVAWLEAPGAATPALLRKTPPLDTAIVYPPRAALLELVAALDLGHLKAVRQQLSALQTQSPASAEFVSRLQALSRDFQLEALRALVTEALDVA